MSEELSQLHEEQKLFQETINLKDCELAVSFITFLISELFECVCVEMIHSVSTDLCHLLLKVQYNIVLYKCLSFYLITFCSTVTTISSRFHM